MSTLELSWEPRRIEIAVDPQSLRPGPSALVVNGHAHRPATVYVTFHEDAEDDALEMYTEGDRLVVTGVLPNSKRQALLDDIQTECITLSVLDMNDYQPDNGYIPAKAYTSAPLEARK